MDEQQAMKITTDHDLLIRIDGKVENLTDSVNKLTDGTAKQLTNHEVRIKALELVNDQVNIKNLYDDVQVNKQWIHDFDFRYKVTLFLAVTVGAFITWFLNNIHSLFMLLGGK